MIADEVGQPEIAANVLAKLLCQAAGQHPDRLVYLGEPYRMATPRGVAFAYMLEAVPLWTTYIQQAQNLIELQGLPKT